MTGKPPPFIMPPDITHVTDEYIDEMLTGIRERRMRAFEIYQVVQEDKKREADDKAREQLEKQGEMLLKEITRLDKQIEKVEERMNKVRALRLQLGID